MTFDREWYGARACYPGPPTRDHATPSKPRPERSDTDSSLRAEREKADDQLASRTAAVEHDADAVIERARDRADSLLEATRVRQDAYDDSPDLLAERVRSSEDRAVDHERAAADAALEVERAKGRETFAHLMSLEREETDDRLHTERVRSDLAVASRDDFLAIVSHDVRGLLDTMARSAELIARVLPADPPHEVARIEARRIGRLTGRMSILVNDLLDVVSMESGKLQVVAVPGSPAPLLAEVAEAFQLAADARQIRLIPLAVGEERLASFDHDRILQVLTNLVGNAMKFTADGGEITIRLAPDATGGVVFSVADNGCGIASDKIELIFERFAQVSQSDRRGLGLGLYIARCIVEAHSGRLWVESEPGRGSAFHFTLPPGRPTPVR